MQVAMVTLQISPVFDSPSLLNDFISLIWVYSLNAFELKSKKASEAAKTTFKVHFLNEFWNFG